MIRMLGARNASARSSERFVILLILTPGAGSSSYIVMTGPGFTSTTFPSTPKSESFFSSSRELAINVSRLIRMSFRSNWSSRVRGGSLKVPFVRDEKLKRVCSAFSSFSFKVSRAGSSMIGAVTETVLFTTGAFAFLPSFSLSRSIQTIPVRAVVPAAAADLPAKETTEKSNKIIRATIRINPKMMSDPAMRR